VIAITAPVSAEDLGSEAVTITIENFGTAAQSDFDVSYAINGGAPVVEQVAGPLNAGETLSYTFTTLGNFSTDGTYDLVAQTALSSDSNSANNATQVSIDNTACTTELNDTDFSIGPNQGTVTESVISITEDVTIIDVNVILNIEHTYNSDLDVFLIGPDGTRVELFTDVGGSGNDFTNTVLDDDASDTIDSGSAPFTGVYSPEGSLADFNGLSSLGDWTLEITDDFNQDGGTLLDWSLQICSSPALSVEENTLGGDFRILNQGNDQFRIVFTTDTLVEDLDLNVYNLLGQKLLWKTMKNEGGEYSYNLDMSYASSGVYIIRFGNTSSGITKRIVVE
jgi:subtilisin-like proprotein convertase family protein